MNNSQIRSIYQTAIWNGASRDKALAIAAGEARISTAQVAELVDANDAPNGSCEDCGEPCAVYGSRQCPACHAAAH